MPDRHPLEDEAALYVLGGLSDAERVEFEGRAAESEELRALIRDLEKGATNLALAAPERRPPAAAWRRIEKTISREKRATPETHPLWTALLRGGWAAAAACVGGWLLYATSVNNARRGTARSDQVAVQETPNSEAHSPQSLDSNAAIRAEEPGNGMARSERLIATQKQENLQLRRQILELQTRLGSISQSLAEDDARLAESNRFKISALGPDGESESASPPSPELQRAIFSALARQLGWTSASDSNGMQFVDLRPATNTAPPQRQPQSDVAEQTPETGPVTPPASNNAVIPSITTRDGVLLAIGPSAAPAGSQVSVTLPSDQGPTTIPLSIGDTPTVFTVPDGSAISVFYNGAAGADSFQYFTSTNHP